VCESRAGEKSEELQWIAKLCILQTNGVYEIVMATMYREGIPSYEPLRWNRHPQLNRNPNNSLHTATADHRH